MSAKKKQVRQNFRDETFKRDHYCCVVCGKKYTKATAEQFLDAHHITDRNDMPNGGYVKENGASLCKTGPSPTCHEKAERVLHDQGEYLGCSPQELYDKIGSSLDIAWAASEQLAPKPEPQPEPKPPEPEEDNIGFGYGGWGDENERIA